MAHLDSSGSYEFAPAEVAVSSVGLYGKPLPFRASSGEVTSMITQRHEYDDRYSNCETTFAELRLYSHTVPPEDMERDLGLKPTSSQKKGQKIPRYDGSERQISVSGFFLSSRSHVASRDLRRHLDWLLGMLASKKLALGALLDRGQIEAAIDCVWWLDGTSGGPIIRADQLAAIADLQLELSVDFGELPRELAG